MFVNSISVSRGSLLSALDPLKHNNVERNNEKEIFVLMNFVATGVEMFRFSDTISANRL